MDWEWTEADAAMFARDLHEFVPERVFDAHAHLYRNGDFHEGVPAMLAAGPAVAGLDAYRARMGQILPRRDLHGMFFGFPAVGMDLDAGNAFAAAEVAADPGSRCALMVRPDMPAGVVEAAVNATGAVGLKPYHVYSAETPTFMSSIEGYLPEEQVRIAHEAGLAIVLHMVRPRALADPANLQTIRRYAIRYPRAKLILAHAARGFNPMHTIEAIGALADLRSVYCDMAAVTECGAMEAIVRALGVDRLLFGSDFPVSHQCGRCVAIGDSFVWLSPENTRFEAAYADLRPTLVGLESLRAMRIACLNLRLSKAEIAAIFWDNAAGTLGLTG